MKLARFAGGIPPDRVGNLDLLKKLQDSEHAAATLEAARTSAIQRNASLENPIHHTVTLCDWAKANGLIDATLRMLTYEMVLWLYLSGQPDLKFQIDTKKGDEDYLYEILSKCFYAVCLSKGVSSGKITLMTPTGRDLGDEMTVEATTSFKKAVERAFSNRFLVNNEAVSFTPGIVDKAECSGGFFQFGFQLFKTEYEAYIAVKLSCWIPERLKEGLCKMREYIKAFSITYIGHPPLS
jgi:hypothetical protein